MRRPRSRHRARPWEGRSIPPCQGTTARVHELVRPNIRRIGNAWLSHAERTGSVDIVVLVLDLADPSVRAGSPGAAREGVDLLVTTQAEAVAFARQAGATGDVIERVARPLPDDGARVLVVSGWLEVIDVADEAQADPSWGGVAAGGT